MRSAVALFVLSWSLIATAAGLGATDRRYVDGIRIEPGSGAVTLVLVVDRALEDGLTKQSAKRKMLGYREWLVDPAFGKNFPEARPQKGVHLVILHKAPRTALGRSVLEQLEGYAREIGFLPHSQLLQLKGRPKSAV